MMPDQFGDPEHRSCQAAELARDRRLVSESAAAETMKAAGDPPAAFIMRDVVRL
jgi:hypothetical protein